MTLRSAESVEEALAMLDRLKALHQTSWRRRGQPGCFAAPWFESFHRDLIRARFSSGEIQLLAAAAGDRPIGYLYNFAHGDRVYAYQSGFDYVADGRLKPGLVTHALAIEQATRAGFATYDFMAGENRLKASFASHWTEMVWLAVQGPSAISWLDRRLADLKNRMSRRSAGRVGPRASLTPARCRRGTSDRSREVLTRAERSQSDQLGALTKRESPNLCAGCTSCPSAMPRPPMRPRAQSRAGLGRLLSRLGQRRIGREAGLLPVLVDLIALFDDALTDLACPHDHVVAQDHRPRDLLRTTVPLAGISPSACARLCTIPVGTVSNSRRLSSIRVSLTACNAPSSARPII